MNTKQFPLFRSHQDQAHIMWSRFLKPGMTAIDATCGNGHDSLYLAKSILNHGNGKLYCLDIQSTAIESTKNRVKTHVSKESFHNIEFYNQSFETFPSDSKNCDFIVYNLGYLPGGDKTITTDAETTLKSIDIALNWIKEGGLISVSCYVGHSEGKRETNLLLEFLSHVCPKSYSVCSYDLVNRKNAPILVLIQKAI